VLDVHTTLSRKQEANPQRNIVARDGVVERHMNVARLKRESK
jgi:hypothetical protein